MYDERRESAQQESKICKKITEKSALGGGCGCFISRIVLSYMLIGDGDDKFF